MNKLQKAFSFNGHKKKKKYFEGWYYKLVSNDSKSTLALIPGISLNDKNSHSFIQVFLYDNVDEKDSLLDTYYLEFTTNEFNYNKGKHIVKIGNNEFSLNNLTLDYKDENISINGTINLIDLSPINTSILSPSIMGIFQYVPLMECYHSIVSMSHKLEGTININDNKFDFDNGKGYIEKDYGRSFPKEYIWLQSNKFVNQDISFMFSYAKVPFLGGTFKGVISSLIFNNIEYRFATYNFARCKIIDFSDNYVKIELIKGKTKLLIDASISTFKELPSPEDGEMKNLIKEGLSGEINIELYKNGELLFEDKGLSSGVEIMVKKVG